MFCSSVRPIKPLTRALAAAAVLVAMAGAGAGSASAASYANPVLRGNYPDPSVVRVGGDFYATATSWAWDPQFPLLKSRDLVNWKTVGAVFGHGPKWSTGRFWAPQIARLGSGYAVYYSARKRGGSLCVAVATAPRPTGPYADKGPLVCDPPGSIDPTPVSDGGRLYLLWKEDANAVFKPTPIWGQELSADGTKLVGERRELFRNDAAWEGEVVENPAVVRRGDQLYMLYAGNVCCGAPPVCQYATGVARATSVLGPWTKGPRNPVLRAGNGFGCPGGGSLVDDGRGGDWFLYHAYVLGGEAVIARQLMLDPVAWGADGWPTVAAGVPSATGSTPLPASGSSAAGGPRKAPAFSDSFRAAKLTPEWGTPYTQAPRMKVDRARGGRLLLAPARGAGRRLDGGIVALRPTHADYTAVAEVSLRGLAGGARAGLVAYQDELASLGIAVGMREAVVWRRVNGRQQRRAKLAIEPKRDTVFVRIVARGRSARLAVSLDGRRWRNVGPAQDRRFMRSFRIGLGAGGAPRAGGRFESFSYTPAP